jgi:hypothetical protein
VGSGVISLSRVVTGWESRSHWAFKNMIQVVIVRGRTEVVMGGGVKRSYTMLILRLSGYIKSTEVGLRFNTSTLK